MATSGSFNTSAYDGYYLAFSWEQTSQSIANNTTTISWKLTGVGKWNNAYYLTQNITVKINGETVFYYPKSSGQIELWNGTVVASGTYTIPHNSDGTKSFTAYAEAGIYNWAVNCTGQGSWTLGTIARKSSMTATSGNLGEAQTLTVNRQSSALTHTIRYTCGTASGTICTKSSNTSISWTPPLYLAMQAPQGTSVSVAFTIETFSGDSSVGTNSTSAMYNIPSNLGPYTTGVSVSDPTGYADYYGAYIQGQSRLKVTINAYGTYGSWVKSYSTVFDGRSYYEQSFESEVILGSGSMRASVVVTDSRNRTVQDGATISVLPYAYPKINTASAYRSDANGNANSNGGYITVKFSPSIYSLNSKNGAWYKVKYKKTTDSSYTTVDLTAYTGNFAPNCVYTFAADESSYNILVLAGDRFKTVETALTGPSVAHTISFLKKNGKIVGMAVGKVAELENTFDIGWSVKFSGGGDCVVEQGEANGWVYRKWQSGIAECWKTVAHSTTVATQWGSLYVGNAAPRQNYPFTFIEKPVEICTLTSGSKMGFIYAEQNGYGVNGASASARYNVCCPSAISTAVEYYFNYHVTGKWK